MAPVRFTIRDTAEQVGVAPETLRSYERMGLLKPDRNSVGHRIYSARDIVRAKEILRRRIAARNTGLLRGRHHG
jgi:DNA-binding transcriptional MerR regulator